MKKTPRRDFIKLITNMLFGAGGLLGLAGIARFFSFQSDPGPPTEFDLGPEANFPKGTLVVRPDIPAAIVYNEEGLIAINLVCTHLGCSVEENPAGEGFLCPCHGSEYDRYGLLLKGPATRNLDRFRIEKQNDDTLRLYTY